MCSHSSKVAAGFEPPTLQSWDKLLSLLSSVTSVIDFNANFSLELSYVYCTGIISDKVTVSTPTDELMTTMGLNEASLNALKEATFINTYAHKTYFSFQIPTDC